LTLPDIVASSLLQRAQFFIAFNSPVGAHAAEDLLIFEGIVVELGTTCPFDICTPAPVSLQSVT
jgi:hypothetical protein